jgi:hypothetical protein
MSISEIFLNNPLCLEESNGKYSISKVKTPVISYEVLILYETWDNLNQNINIFTLIKNQFP